MRLYRLPRTMRTAQAIASRHPKRIVRRVKNIAVVHCVIVWLQFIAQ